MSEQEVFLENILEEEQDGVDKLTEYDVLNTLETAAEHAAQTGGEWIVEASEVVGLVYELAKIDQAVKGLRAKAKVE